MNESVLLKTKHLTKFFPVKTGVFRRTSGWVKAVDDVSFQVYPGETFGIVGESGCGKSTLGMTILRLIEPTSGSVFFEDRDVTTLSSSQLLRFRKNIQMIFQDPFSSLNPRMRVGSIIGEGMTVHGVGARSNREFIVRTLLEKVGLQADSFDRYPHEFSGGQRQRIGIARALAISPKLIIADEAVSALDVSIRSQIINLMADLKTEFQLTYLFISHDLSVVKHLCDRIMVMYLGKTMEITTREILFCRPLHPYTVSLISAVPVPDPDYHINRILLLGDVPSPVHPPSGCRFHTRCPVTRKKCETDEPLLIEQEPFHFVACHYPGTLAISVPLILTSDSTL
ncbi:MAG: oligopeptide/dipeptide ABC transporter ATP-binding protein [Atribacterota bacterium]|nr:ATP-binding cassette domain-containing protein [Candidatus Atribacteria bacterium]